MCAFLGRNIKALATEKRRHHRVLTGRFLLIILIGRKFQPKPSQSGCQHKITNQNDETQHRESPET